MYRLVIFFFLSGCIVEGFSQNQRHTIRNYTAIDGLPQSQVEAIVEDENGYLWIGTQGGGLARFDGRQFRVYTTLDGLLSNFVLGLEIDQQGNIWVLHPRGVTKYNGLGFKKFTSDESHISHKEYRRMIAANDSIHFFFADGMASIYQDSVYHWNKPFLNGMELYGVHQGADGSLILYLENGNLLIRAGNRQFVIETDIIDDRLFNFFNHGQEVWCRSGKTTYRLNLKERKLEKLPEHIPRFVLVYDEIKNIYWTRDRYHLYRGSMNSGELNSDTVLRDVSVSKVLLDSEDNVWIASNGSGLFKYYLQDFDRCSSDNMRGVMAIHIDRDGASWIGTMSKGLWKIKKGQVTSYANGENAFRNTILKIGEAPDGTLWVASNNGLGRYNKVQDTFHWFTTKDGLPVNHIVNFSFNDRNGMWIGTGGGLSYYDGSSFKNYDIQDGLSSRGIWTTQFMPRFQTLYIGTEFGINTIRGKEKRVSAISIPELDNTAVLSIHPYRDSLLLIGSGGAGVVVFDPASHKRRMITTHDGLASDFVYFVASDDDQRIWIGTEKGISCITLDDHLDILQNLHYDHDNGLKGIETNQNAYYLGKTEKYFGLVDGLYQFNNLSKTNVRSFDLHLTDVQILYGEYPAHVYSDSRRGFFKIPDNPILPADRNHLTFHFNRVDKRYPKSVRFKYYLQNFDKTWSQPSSATHVTYSNLPPGHYVFRVMATNNMGSWSENKISYAFIIQAPFYKTPTFIAGLIIFVAGSITLLMYLRVRQRMKKMIDIERIRMQELESLRKEIARDFHDEMGNQLTRIINYVSLLKLNGNGGGGSGHHHDLYSKVEESAKYLFTGTRDFIWSIDPVNDELTKLFIHIRDFGEKLFDEKNINFRAYDEVKEPIKLPNGFSREANLIFKEAMTNAFKYSQARNATLTLKREGDGFEMVFEDDGVGFLTGQIEKSSGLKNIRERAERIGAILRIHSEINQGVRITLAFKLTKTLHYGATF